MTTHLSSYILSSSLEDNRPSLNVELSIQDIHVLILFYLSTYGVQAEWTMKLLFFFLKLKL